jgi:hypothetical protein
MPRTESGPPSGSCPHCFRRYTSGGTGGVTRQPHLRARCCAGWPPCVRGPARPCTFRQSVEAAPSGPARPPAALRLGKKARPRTALAAKRPSNCPKIRHLRCARGPLVPRRIRSLGGATLSWARPQGGSTPGETLHPQGPPSVAVTRPSPFGKKKKSLWPPFKVQAAAWSRDGRPEGRSKLPTLR